MQAERRPPSPPMDPAVRLPAVDTSLRFVRVLEQRPGGLVTFEFAIGWPELAVELMLPAAAFDAFCAANKVRRLDA
jgi:phenol hydroxylase P0 protein